MYDNSEPMGVDLLELAEFINKVGGIEDLYMLEFENQRQIKMLKALGENPKISELADKIVWLEERVEHYRSEIEIPEGDRMEVTTERLRQIRAKMTRQFHSIENLKEEKEKRDDLLDELEQNLFAAEDQNHYFQLARTNIDENIKLKEEIELYKSLNRAIKIGKIVEGSK